MYQKSTFRFKLSVVEDFGMIDFALKSSFCLESQTRCEIGNCDCGRRSDRQNWESDHCPISQRR